MPDFTVRSDSVNVEQIMDQIRARIREKRGVDYTEQQIRELAAVKLEKFLDPRGVRSDLLEQFRKAQPAYKPPELPNYAFEDQTLYESTRPPLRWIRRLLNPILKLFFNPNPLIQALNIQSRLNTMYGEREARREATRRAFDQLQYELMHNLVIETTRMSIEVKNLKMRIESLAGRLEFNERRARALESVVAYKPSAEDRFETPPSAAAGAGATGEPGPVVTTVPAPPAFREPQGRPDFNRGANQSGQSSPGVREPQGRPDQSRAPANPGQIPAAGSGQPGEGPGQRSRRRRRRRGRRGGGGSAASVMGGTSQGDAGGGSTAAPPAASSPTAIEPEEPTSSSSGADHPTGSGSDSSTGSGSEPSSGSGQDPATRPDQEPQARSGQDDPQ